MVAKTLKKSPTKSIKRCIQQQRKKSSPAKASVVITALHDSLFTCRRRLAKIFSKLARLSTSTPSKRSPQKPRKGFRKIKPEEDDQESEVQVLIPAQKSLFFGLLPPPLDPGARTVFLDLDETLIHSSPDPPPERYDFVVRPVIDGESMNFYVLKRPGVDELLDLLSRSKFEIVVFTAGLKEYASLVLDKLDTDRVISHRLYRDSCREMDGRYVKDLSQMGRDLKRVLLVDDNPSSYVFQPHNAIQIRPFVDDLQDKELWRLIDFFHASHQFQDLTQAIRLFAPFNSDAKL